MEAFNANMVPYVQCILDADAISMLSRPLRMRVGWFARASVAAHVMKSIPVHARLLSSCVVLAAPVIITRLVLSTAAVSHTFASFFAHRSAATAVDTFALGPTAYMFCG